MRLADAIAAASGPTPEPANRGTFTTDSTGGEFKDVVVNRSLNDNFDHVFELFKADPTRYEIVEDTVRCSTWQQSKATEDGKRDVAQLYSYSARFRRINRDMVRPEVFEAWREDLIGDHSEPVVALAKAAANGTYTIPIADPQLGKKGTRDAVRNWKRGVRAHLAEARHLIERGLVSAVHVAWMGDESEGVCNNYENQPHTIELNQSQQLELDTDLRIWTLRKALKLGVPVSASSVISNHGEWTRNGSKNPVTSSNDNASTHIARQVKKYFEGLEEFGVPPIQWTIGDTHPGITITLSGVECYFSHGYIEKGRGTSTETRTRAAIERQILGRTEDLGTTKLWVMAHYHHAYYQEFEGRTLFGCPALEAERSSEYMLDQYGVWSPAGMLGFVVTSDNPRGWAHKNIF